MDTTYFRSPSPVSGSSSASNLPGPGHVPVRRPDDDLPTVRAIAECDLRIINIAAQYRMTLLCGVKRGISWLNTGVCEGDAVS